MITQKNERNYLIQLYFDGIEDEIGIHPDNEITNGSAE